jgi:DNA-binding IclR family transcriptional regulator
MELIALRPGGLTHTDICRMLAIPKSSCSYILSRLEHHRYISRDKDTGRYEVGLKLVGLAHGVRENSRAHHILEPILRKFVDEAALTVAVGVLLQGSVVLIENIENCRSMRVNLSVGLDLPFYNTALGKILIAHLSKEDIDQIIDMYGFSGRDSATSLSKTKLMCEIETVRKQQYATNTRVVGVCSVAVPIFDACGSVCAGLVATGAASEKVWNGPRSIVEQLRATAQEISDNTRSLDWQQLP